MSRKEIYVSIQLWEDTIPVGKLWCQAKIEGGKICGILTE